MLGLLAKKVGMTQVFDEEGNSVPVTVLELFENVITEKRTIEKNGYTALQIGAKAEAEEKDINKPEAGHLKKNNLKFFKLLKEFRVPAETVAKYEIGTELSSEEVLGGEGSLVDIAGRPIGKGTSGRIQRWNQHRRTMSHGTKHHRQIGSAGAGTTPGRVFKGLKMPGRDSQDVTISHLAIVKHLPEKKVVLVRGAVPGHKGAIVSIKPSKQKGKWNELARQLGKAVSA
jgi:large subunit ribosomal protein L3